LSAPEKENISLKLLIYAYDWAPFVGGVQTVTKDLAEGIYSWSKAHADQAIDVTLITETPCGSMNDSVLPFRVIRRPGLAVLLAHIWSADIVHLANPAFLPLVIAWLVRKPTVIEHHGYHSICPNGLLLYKPDNTACPGYFMAGAYGRCIGCCCGSMGGMRGFRTVLLTFLRRWLCAHASANISITDHVAQRISLPRVQTIYHGVRDSGFDTSVKTSTSENCLQIGYVGRFVEEKGLPILLQAAKKLKEAGVSFRLTLIGDGDVREKLESEVDRLGIRERIRFTGYLTGTALDVALEEIQVIVMTSQVEESAGLAAMEHMMRAGVVVVADIGGLSEVVGDAGLKFVPGDPNSLFVRLREIAENPSAFGHLPMAARHRAMDKFALPAMIEEHISLYQKL
jgi:glycosyltransferase involved in cell wall biosynthesis